MSQQYQVFFNSEFSFLVDADDLDGAVEQARKSGQAINDEDAETCRVEWMRAPQVHVRLEKIGSQWVEVSRQDHT